MILDDRTLRIIRERLEEDGRYTAQELFDAILAHLAFKPKAKNLDANCERSDQFQDAEKLER